MEITESGMTGIRNMKMGHSPVKKLAIFTFLTLISKLRFRSPVLTSQTGTYLHFLTNSRSGSKSTPFLVC